MIREMRRSSSGESGASARTGRFHPQFRMSEPVRGVEHEPDRHPCKEADERRWRCRAHEDAGAHCTEERYEVCAAWNPEGTWNIRMPDPERHNADADEDEREEGSDARQVTQHAERQKAARHGAQNSGHDRRHVRRAEARMNL